MKKLFLKIKNAIKPNIHFLVTKTSSFNVIRLDFFDDEFFEIYSNSHDDKIQFMCFVIGKDQVYIKTEETIEKILKQKCFIRSLYTYTYEIIEAEQFIYQRDKYREIQMMLEQNKLILSNNL